MSEFSIAALRTFRAVARSGSFTAAARDLGCAQSAVSRQIAALEAHVQRVLVLRGHRQVQLTPAGEIYLETVNRALDELDHGAMRLASNAATRATVKILAMPSFAARWLLPRLAELPQAHVDVDIELATSFWDADFRKERFDLAIHYGDGSWPGAQFLMHDSLSPVAAPRLLAGETIREIGDLQRFTWLHGALRNSRWPQWLAACGAAELKSERNMKLQDTESVLSAAIAGLGIAMGNGALVDHELREGRLVEVWPRHIHLAAGYYLLTSKRAQRNAGAHALAQWLLAQAQAFDEAQRIR
ncbi:LysR substrate-binding domain-containing protein [uncultured Hydrogenophaga sp.]|uniref:LysR substrate-binding domain-containing protein n=1 Tax=uncultured Hydrogenophaga sp. TaxID=199683 RepID=UPI002589FCA8|nr:LysR substrate-binding domain-containing protein [uncultured Hydrogenophaga sp.]